MPFFEPPSPPPGGGPRDVEPELRGWFGPPGHVLGTPVGVRVVLVHRPDLAIAATAFAAFPTVSSSTC